MKKTYLDETRCPFQSVDASSNTVGTAAKRSTTRIDVSACLVIVLQGITVRADGGIQSGSLMSAGVVTATR